METFALDDVRTSLEVNVIGAYLTVQRALPHLGEGSTVVFVTSVNAELAQPGSSAYAATKAAQASMIKVFAAELLPRGVRVNGVRPGPVDTPMWHRLGLSDDELAATKAAVASGVPMGRFGDPEEIASAITFLAGPASSFVVGEELTVDGGVARL